MVEYQHLFSKFAYMYNRLRRTNNKTNHIYDSSHISEKLAHIVTRYPVNPKYAYSNIFFHGTITGEYKFTILCDNKQNSRNDMKSIS